MISETLDHADTLVEGVPEFFGEWRWELEHQETETFIFRHRDELRAFRALCLRIIPRPSSVEWSQTAGRYLEDVDETATNIDEAELLELEEAAASEDPSNFETLAKAIDWSSRRPFQLTRAIDLALRLNLLTLARELAKQGLRLFPQNPRIREAAKVLAPPRVLATLPGHPGRFEATLRWLKDNSSQYRGQWIAVRDGVLLAVAATPAELYRKIGKDRTNPSTVIVRVLR